MRCFCELVLLLAALLACAGTEVPGRPPAIGSEPQSNAGSTERQYTPGEPTVLASPRQCRSDFDCGMGHKCAKDSLAFQGVCAQVVNEYGTPTYASPESDSIGPGKGQCAFDTECPFGFRCVKTSGGLRGNCMK